MLIIQLFPYQQQQQNSKTGHHLSGRDDVGSLMLLAANLSTIVQL